MVIWEDVVGPGTTDQEDKVDEKDEAYRQEVPDAWDSEPRAKHQKTASG